MDTSVADQIYERCFEELAAARSDGPDLVAALRRLKDDDRLQRDSAVVEAYEELVEAAE